MAKRKSILKPGKTRSPTHSSLSKSPETLTVRRVDLAAVIRQLDLIMATVSVARSALIHQAADGDLDVATVLRLNVLEPLGQQIDRLREFLPEDGV